ncbi:MAG: hypothetical protein MHMPM18_002319 [Marteilia pararefringens]
MSSKQSSYYAAANKIHTSQSLDQCSAEYCSARQFFSHPVARQRDRQSAAFVSSLSQREQ